MPELLNEVGLHRIQRVPTTEKTKSRVHSSSVLVSVVLPEMQLQISNEIKESDLSISWFSGTGAGGQHRNKHQNSCRIIHIPTGICATAQTRSQINSKQQAIDEIKRKVILLADKQSSFAVQSLIAQQMKKAQALSSRRRTYRFQEGLVHDHVSGKSTTAQKFFNGLVDILWQ